MREYDIIVIGAGITGAGTARDCALRGFKTILIDKSDIAAGATGRNHGLLHSGARYAVKDAESANECIIENKIIRKTAPHCVEQTGGLFITLPEDTENGYGLDYQETFIEACFKSGIDAQKLTPTQARQIEPSVNPGLIGAVKVPDCSVDPFKLCASNVLDARIHGADILIEHEVIELMLKDGNVIGVKARKKGSGEIIEIFASITINAAGIWGASVAAKAGINISMYPAKGTLLVFAHRINRLVINRCRKSADGDILVPGGNVSVIGTTSTKIPFEECDDVRPTDDEVQLMLTEGCKLCPELASTRILRAYSGVRPLVASDDDPTGRSISRGIVCLDHETRDGVGGFITITGGKLTSYRMMAKIATDLACKKLGNGIECTTDTLVLPDTMPVRKPYAAGPLICECENVSAEDVQRAIINLDAKSLIDIRRRTRLGMGTCQGTNCIRKAAKLLEKTGNGNAVSKIHEYVTERWKGMTPVGWGEGLREMELMQRVYKKDIEL